VMGDLCKDFLVSLYTAKAIDEKVYMRILKGIWVPLDAWRSRLISHATFNSHLVSNLAEFGSQIVHACYCVFFSP
jgi:hypothetical protein